MKRLNFPLLADVLFYALCAFWILLCVLRYYRMPIGWSLFVSACVSIAVGTLCFLLFSGKNQKKLLGKKEAAAREALLLHLALEKEDRVRAALVTAYCADGKEAHVTEEDLVADGKTVVPLFTMEPLGADRVARLIRRLGKGFTIACNALTPEAHKLCRSFSIEEETGDTVYALFTRTGTTPNPLICGDLPRKTAKERLFRSFSKSNARPFFVSGAALLGMSLFAFYPVYYLVSGAVLLFTAVIVRLFGYASEG